MGGWKNGGGDSRRLRDQGLEESRRVRGADPQLTWDRLGPRAGQELRDWREAEAAGQWAACGGQGSGREL